MGFLKDILGIHTDGNGEEVTIWKDGSRTKTLHGEYWLDTGEQWCPNCKMQMTEYDEYYTCPSCGRQISRDDIEEGLGYPSLEAINEQDYGWEKVYGEEEMDSWEDL